MKTARITLFAAALTALGAMTAAALAQTNAEPAGSASGRPAPAHLGDADGAFVTPFRFNEPNGALMYKRVCAGCHMPDGKGAEGAGHYPALAGNEKLAANSYPLYVVLHGLNGMPPVGKMMSDQQVADVVNYVRTHFGNRYRDAVTAADAAGARQ